MRWWAPLFSYADIHADGGSPRTVLLAALAYPFLVGRLSVPQPDASLSPPAPGPYVTTMLTSSGSHAILVFGRCL